ncbi:cation:proton antiporter [bacterium]|nr:cation:proton antiporter [bacterium]
MSTLVMGILLAILGVCLVLLVVRLLMGPTNWDRVTSIESLTLVLLCAAAVWSAFTGTEWFFDAIVVLSLVGFLSTVALARYLEDGRLSDE